MVVKIKTPPEGGVLILLEDEFVLGYGEGPTYDRALRSAVEWAAQRIVESAETLLREEECSAQKKKRLHRK